jgi:tRNA (Thr-GGU) A37 N-methylase
MLAPEARAHVLLSPAIPAEALQGLAKFSHVYVLFLFQIYNYSEGVQGCCERLDLKQELISYYIQKKDPAKVLEICTRYTT